MNSKKFPGAAARIDMMWRKTNIKWGQRSSGKPLTYLGNKMSVDGSGKIQSDRNRSAHLCQAVEDLLGHRPVQ